MSKEGSLEETKRVAETRIENQDADDRQFDLLDYYENNAGRLVVDPVYVTLPPYSSPQLTVLLQTGKRGRNLEKM